MADIITGAPSDLTYGHWLVQQAWMVVWAITSAALVVILGWMGLSFIMAERLGRQHAGWREMVPRLVPDTGHHANGNGPAPAPVNRNGHHDEAPEPQQTLFSWAEFMAEEPEKSKGRGRKPQPGSSVDLIREARELRDAETGEWA